MCERVKPFLWLNASKKEKQQTHFSQDNTVGFSHLLPRKEEKERVSEREFFLFCLYNLKLYLNHSEMQMNEIEKSKTG